MKNKYVFGCLFAVLFLFVSSAYAFDIVVIQMDIYRNDTVVLRNLTVTNGETNIETEEPGDYRIILLSEDGKALFEVNFTLKFYAYEEGFDEEGNMIGRRVEFGHVSPLMRLPYYGSTNDTETAKPELVHVYHNDSLIFESNLPPKGSSLPLTTTESRSECGNGVCEQDETVENCYQDCQQDFLVYIAVLLLVVVLVVVYVFYMKMKEGDIEKIISRVRRE